MSEPLIKPASWMAKLDLVNRLVLQHNVLISVFAERDGGKTSFFKMLESGLDTAVLPIIVRATPPFDEKNLLYKISQECDFLNAPVKNMAQFVTEVNRSQKHILLLIDDAQHLPMLFIESLLLVLKDEGDKSYFHICLASGYSLVETLNKLASGAYQNLIQGIELGPLTLEETQDYISKKLLSLEKPYHKVLTAPNLQEFYELTQGRLALINRHAQAFFDAKLVMKKWKMPVSKQLAAMLVVISIIAFGGVAIWQAQGIETTDVDDLSIELIPPAPEEEQIPFVEQDAYLESSIPPLHQGAKLTFIEPALMKKSDQFQFAKNTEDEAFNPNLVVMDKVVVIPKTIIKQASLKAIKAEKSLPKVASVPINHSAQPIYRAYTIQLIASRDLKDINRFKATHALSFAVNIMRSNRQGQTWYVLTTGQFSSRQEASQNLKQLPGKVLSLNPWVRPTKDLQPLG